MLVALVAVLEKGPLAVPLYVGAHPLNRGPLGTSDFYDLLSQGRDVVTVSQWGKAVEQLGNACGRVLIVIVSPETPYTEKDLEHISTLKHRCRELALLVADETGYSNMVLQAVGSSVRIKGEVIEGYVPVYLETPWGWRGLLVLDKPSLLYYNGTESFYAYQNPTNVEVFVIGDGSILLNQVLRSNISEPYREFAKSAVDYLCRGDCLILLEASKYQTLSPQTVLRMLVEGESPEIIALIDPANLAIALLAIILSPSTWLPPLLAAVDGFVRDIARDPYLGIALIAVSILMLTLILSHREEKVRDEKLRDVAEVEWYGYGEFRRIVKSKSLGRDDFVQLYQIVDSVLRSTTGVSLDSEEVASVLETHGVDGQKARRYWEFMNRYYRRATGRSRWPIIVFWGRVARSALSQSEEVLDSLGASLKKLKGIEERRS